MRTAKRRSWTKAPQSPAARRAAPAAGQAHAGLVHRPDVAEPPPRLAARRVAVPALPNEVVHPRLQVEPQLVVHVGPQVLLHSPSPTGGWEALSTLPTAAVYASHVLV